MIKLDTFGKTIFPVYLNVDDPEKNSEPMEKLYYVLNKDGLTIVTNNEYYTQERKISTIGGSLQNGKDKEYTLKTERIDSDTFKWLLAFFREVYKTYSSEVNVLLYYSDSTKTWYCRVPEQTVSAASVSYKLTDADAWYCKGVHLEKEPENIHLFGTIHSHAAMSAFFSGTDDGDDKHNEGIQIVVGKVASMSPEVKCRVALNGTFKDVELEAVVEYDSTFPSVSIPAIITKGTATVTQTTTAGTTTYSGYSQGSHTTGGGAWNDSDYDENWYYQGRNYGTAYGKSSSTTKTTRKSSSTPKATKIVLEADDGTEITTNCLITSVYLNK